jgi:hypothetical protein
MDKTAEGGTIICIDRAGGNVPTGNRAGRAFTGTIVKRHNRFLRRGILMRHIFTFALVPMAGALLFAATPAAAQSTQTWVGSGGSDVGTCTRAAPCSTFTFALTQTSAGGQINCVDRANYGAVLIAQSVTIECSVGGIVVSSGAAVTVTAGTTDVVTIRGLQIDGASASTGNGIAYTTGGKLFLEGVSVRNFLSDGVAVTLSTNGQLLITDSIIDNNRSSIAGAGLYVAPTGTPVVNISMTDVSMNGNTSAGIRIRTTGMTGGGVTIKVRDSSFIGNGFGILAQAPGGTAAAVITIQDSEIARNSNHGLAASGPMAQLIVSNTMISGNAMGVVPAGGGAIISTGDNVVVSNSTGNGVFSSTLAKQ